jgi:polyisoprenoid-binding protein YceI
MAATEQATNVVAATRRVAELEAPLDGTYDIDPSHTDAGFVVRHLMVSKVRGSFENVSGTIVIAEDPFESELDVTIETASVATGDEQRDAHLRSPDFLDVEQFPQMTYRSRTVRQAGPERFIVEGDLTVHGVTRPLELDVRFEGGIADPWGNVRAGFSARAEIDRYDFGITSNQALEGGGVLVGRKVTIELEAEAVRRS